ncbi:MAG TPA: DNA polymerase/3'-5' exonuclease PolX [Haliangium sp.]|nr:DNA polymerase/3'-5' exonuclease PolX [Haliangium sp.]
MAGERDEILAHLRELAELIVLDEQNPQSFRARAYDNAINALSARGDEIARMSKAELKALDGVGASMADKIRELLDTGKIAKLEELRKKYPPEYVELSKIPGLGPKRVARLHAELGVASVADLRRAIDSQRLRELSGFGAKMEGTLRKAIERLGMTGKERRTPISEAMPLARRVVAALADVPGVERVEYGGSLRRFRETIGDIDIVAAATEPVAVMEAFVALPLVSEVLARGDTKTSVLTQAGLQIDLRVVAPAEHGAAMLYFTGSKSHNIKLRQRALARGLTLNEYGLSNVESGATVAAATEQEIYAALDLAWIPPPMREDTGEIERSEEGTLPVAPAVDEIRGDLHVHTVLSGDGRSPLEDIVAQAHARGYQYLAITDHGEDLVMNGVSRQDLTRQRDELARLQERYPKLRLMHGCELNIGPKGGLDYDPDFRLELDWCVAAVHSHFDLGQADQTRRIIKAMEDPAVNVIGHLTGRYIGRRPGIEVDIDAVLEAAVETGTAIEINSALDRLDVSADVLRRAHELGVLFLIDTDSHHISEFERMQWGCLQAARGWLPKERVLNTWPRQKFLAWARKKRKGAA